MATDNSGFIRIANEIGALVEEKNQAYGDSFAKTGDFLRLLYPDGIPPEKYDDALCLVRMWDKMKRIATDQDALGESPYRDIAGYALLGIRIAECKKMPLYQLGHAMTPREFAELTYPLATSTGCVADLTAGDGGIDKGI